MNDQAQDNQPSEGQPIETAPQTPSEQPPIETAPQKTSDQQSETAQPARKFKLTRKFAVGFLGWYLVMALGWYLVMVILTGSMSPHMRLDLEGTVVYNLIIFPLQILALIFLFVIRKLRDIGWGMLSALGVNLVISLVLGLVFNALCFMPFFYPFG